MGLVPVLVPVPVREVGMEDEVEADEESLSSFLTEWRRELSLRGQRNGVTPTSAPGSCGRIAAESPRETTTTEGTVEDGRLLGKRSSFVDDAEEEEHGASPRKEEKLCDPPPMFVLPPGRRMKPARRQEAAGGPGELAGEKGRDRSAVRSDRGSLVDTLIADLVCVASLSQPGPLTCNKGLLNSGTMRVRTCTADIVAWDSTVPGQCLRMMSQDSVPGQCPAA